MDWKKLFYNGETSTTRKRENNAEVKVGSGLYSDMLGLNRKLDFILLETPVTSQVVFDTVAKAAKDVLSQDLKRLGESFYEIKPALRNKLMGTIGSMTLTANENEKANVKFHKRDEKGLWDGISKKFPEKETTAKYKCEIFFVFEDDEEDED